MLDDSLGFAGQATLVREDLFVDVLRRAKSTVIHGPLEALKGWAHARAREKPMAMYLCTGHLEQIKRRLDNAAHPYCHGM